MIFDVDSLKKSTNVSVTIYIYWDKEVACLIHWHFKGKWPKFSLSALHGRGSCFKNFALPCPQGTILIELKASKRPKRIHACIYILPADSYLLTSTGQPSCTQPLGPSLTLVLVDRFDMPTVFLSCASDHS